jgi:hypothetical protein
LALPAWKAPVAFAVAVYRAADAIAELGKADADNVIHVGLLERLWRWARPTYQR